MAAPAIFIPIGVFLASIIGPLVARVLLSLGVGVITYKGVDTMLQNLVTTVEGAWGGVGAKVVAVAHIAGVDQFMSIILSSITAAITLKLVSGAIKKLSFLPQTEA
ncbi:DUF2523 domain-containing protein [Gilvimarinus sp. 1_MG-2023]|uniref:DUF2523 domain-containing protein n=1 Tax=Gilvimarinus sp. 1_MG-2023 TaxID=3062638 RepID=UPI0026E1F496|nr:DUF2523 domain-containing protein [Gilvimarinus sp. 1_MG-2023]MDO6748527.1 DUF2523 domain-containing protein [Gilvimarinus sp. 1_MG-2023]